MSDQNDSNNISNSPISTSDANFESDVLNADVPVLVDFWAEWCGPCKMIAPVLDELAADYDGKVKIAKLDIDANPQTTAKFAVRSIPALILFKDGQVAAQSVGVASKSKLAAMVETAL